MDGSVDESGEEVSDSLVGKYVEIWGINVEDYTTHEITDNLWKQVHGGTFPYTALYHLVVVDPSQSFLVAQNDSVYSWYPEKWTRIDWVVAGETVYFCETLTNGESMETALETKAAKNSDLDRYGCNGFPWERMLRQSDVP